MDLLEPETNKYNVNSSSNNFNNSNNKITNKRKKFGIIFLGIVVVGIIIGAVIIFTSSSNSNNKSNNNNNNLVSSSTGKKKKVTDVRLPTSLTPLHYKLNLIPHLNPADNFIIDGTTSIDLLCKENTSSIILHIKKITIVESAVTVLQLNESETHNENIKLPIEGHEYDVDRDFYIVKLESELVPGLKYRIYIEYHGLLSDELVGFYRSSYIDKTTNETRWLAITQFSPTDARRAFPSFDEPALKATFEISLGRLQNMSSLSNMNLVNTEPIEGMPGWFWDHYNKTFLMSTYLIGFAVTDFIPREATNSSSKTKVQIWSRKDAINQTDYAAQVGPKMLSYFEEYFNIDFPLPKQDIIAIPDMRFSAMENWGLITFRELFILFDPKYSSDGAKRRIIEIVGHEIAHQWFGNLVGKNDP